MASHIACVISKDRLPSLDSRFYWTNSLQESDCADETVFVLHSIKDEDKDASYVNLFADLSKLRKKDPRIKFLYINSQPDPFIEAFFFGIGGIVINEDLPLVAPDILINVIDEYTASDLKVDPPVAKFATIERALKDILSGELDEMDLYDVITNPSWRETLRSSIDTVSTSLTVVEQSQHELTTFVDRTRNLMLGYKSEIAKITADLEAAKANMDRLEALSGSAGNDRNTVKIFPQTVLSQHVQKVLYIQEFAPCPFLTSYILSYMQWLKTKVGIQCRLLVVQAQTAKRDERYDQNVFYNIDKSSIGHLPPQGMDSFILSEPYPDLMAYFFDPRNVKLFIVIDRLLQASPVLRSNPRIKTLYASGSVSYFEKQQINKANTISAMRRDIKDGGFNIPFIPNITRAQAVGFYYKTCLADWQRLNSILDIP